MRALSDREEAYRDFFQKLIDELREVHGFTHAKTSKPKHWYHFPSGFRDIRYSAAFGRRGNIRVTLRIDTRDTAANKRIYDALFKDKDAIEAEYGAPLEWLRKDNLRHSRIFILGEGTIHSSAGELEDIHRWFVQHLLKMKKVLSI